MSLKNVSSFGTEGRRNGVNELAAGDSILGQVKFKLELIKQFEIVKVEAQESDPAIVEQSEATEEKNEKGWDRGSKVNRTGQREYAKPQEDASQETKYGDTTRER